MMLHYPEMTLSERMLPFSINGWPRRPEVRTRVCMKCFRASTSRRRCHGTLWPSVESRSREWWHCDGGSGSNQQDAAMFLSDPGDTRRPRRSTSWAHDWQPFLASPKDQINLTATTSCHPCTTKVHPAPRCARSVLVSRVSGGSPETITHSCQLHLAI